MVLNKKIHSSGQEVGSHMLLHWPLTGAHQGLASCRPGKGLTGPACLWVQSEPLYHLALG